MRTSNKGILAIITHEGIVPGPYFDSVGVLTYGVGHTKSAGGLDPSKLIPGMPDNLDGELVRVFATFRKDLEKFESRVSKAIAVDISQEMFDAAVSFDFNTGAIHRATWVKRLNAGDVAGASRAIMSWKKPAEIIPRRRAEQRLFQDGVYPETKITVWQVGKDRKVIWKPAVKLSGGEALALLRGESRRDAPAPDKSNHRALTGLGAAIAAVIAAVAATVCKIPFLSSILSTCGG